jgi:putative transposase
MPEHVHLLLSEPERGNLAVVLQMLKQIVSQQLNERATTSFWQPRYYDFNVWRRARSWCCRQRGHDRRSRID